MTDILIKNSGAVTLIGGGELEKQDVLTSLAQSEALIAADGAADCALGMGLMPDAVIGDFDSISLHARETIPPQRLHHIAEQDSTDFEKCLSRVQAPLVYALGFTGARMDHELAVYTVLTRYPQTPCIVIGKEDVCVHIPVGVTLDVAVGTRVSLFPMGPVTGRSTGLRWPIEGLQFAPWGQIGTSNAAVSPRVDLSFDGPGMLLILPRDCLSMLAQAIRRSGG